jgi:hypothetical protein
MVTDFSKEPAITVSRVENVTSRFLHSIDTHIINYTALYLHAICFHGVLLNEAQGRFYILQISTVAPLDSESSHTCCCVGQVVMTITHPNQAAYVIPF